MRATFVALILLALACLTSSQISASPSHFKPTNRGMTWTVKKEPQVGNGWAGIWGCDSFCDAYNGDTSCSSSRPILCIRYYKSMFPPATTSPALNYYYGWSGGIVDTTNNVVGSTITSQAVGDSICQSQLGASDWKMAEFHMGHRMASGGSWNWGSAVRGGWNFWAYFATTYTNRAWVWIDDQPNGNCD